jgi:serine/threonine protein kinase
MGLTMLQSLFSSSANRRTMIHNEGNLVDSLDHYIGNYRLLRLLGQGAFASVYLGEHRYLKRLAAIKVLHTVLNDRDKENFFEEARLLANLSHAHIVHVLEFAVTPKVNQIGIKRVTEYIPYLVMDFAPGNSLRAIYPAGSYLFADMVVSYVKQIAAALQYAHNKGIIHRDVKPENCLLNEQQEVMLSDFGLALFAPTPDLLSTQQMAGTLPYTAPEQLRGKPGFASDQYSLGVIAYEWLCGHRPFEGEEVDIIMQHISSPPQSLRSQNPAISQVVEEVVLKALEKNPQQRYSSVQEFANALEHASQGNKYDTTPYSHVAVRGSSSNQKKTDDVLPSFFPNFEVESVPLRETKGLWRVEEVSTSPSPVKQEQAARVRGAQRHQQWSERSVAGHKKMRMPIIVGVLLLILLVGISRTFYLKTSTTSSARPAETQTHPTVDPVTLLPPLPGAADFTVNPPGVRSMALMANQTIFQGDHSTLGPNQQIVANFFIPGSAEPGQSKEVKKQISIFIRALVTRSGNNEGYAPIDLYSNGQLIVQNFTFPGNGFQPNETGFQIPPGQLVYGKNEIKLLISHDALNKFWLYRIGISIALPSAPAVANFAVSPSTIRDMTLVTDETSFEGDRSALGTGQRVVINFFIPGSAEPGQSKEVKKQISIFIRALVTRSGDNEGYAPIDLYSNGQPIVQNFTFPGNGFQPNQTSFQIPPGQLMYGKNEVKLLVSGDARNEFWLYRMGIIFGTAY